MPVKEAVVTGLFVYPVKSCAGISLTNANLVERGFEFDRQWTVVNDKGLCLTQRDFPKMALIGTGITPAGELQLEAPGQPPHTVSPRSSDDIIISTVWGNDCESIDEGDAAAAWLQQYLQTSCRLMRVAPGNTRQTKKSLPDGTTKKITFVDDSPLLVVSQESLNDLNQRMEAPIPMDRFRVSIVIEGLGAYAEDELAEITIGGLSLFKAKPCARCVITTIDQLTLEKGREPLNTLATYRMVNNKVLFGTYFLHQKIGTISVGAKVTGENS